MASCLPNLADAAGKMQVPAAEGHIAAETQITERAAHRELHCGDEKRRCRE
jgi:hypothetical protein